MNDSFVDIIANQDFISVEQYLNTLIKDQPDLAKKLVFEAYESRRIVRDNDLADLSLEEIVEEGISYFQQILRDKELNVLVMALFVAHFMKESRAASMLISLLRKSDIPIEVIDTELSFLPNTSQVGHLSNSSNPSAVRFYGNRLTNRLTLLLNNKGVNNPRDIFHEIIVYCVLKRRLRDIPTSFNYKSIDEKNKILRMECERTLLCFIPIMESLMEDAVVFERIFQGFKGKEAQVVKYLEKSIG